MLRPISLLRGYAINARNDPLGAVEDFLFDDRSWKLRWLVAETFTWLRERKILLHLSAVGQIDRGLHLIKVGLARTQVENSPAFERSLPVSRQMERQLYSYYNWDPTWSDWSCFDSGALPSPLDASAGGGADNPHLRSTSLTTGCGLQAMDGNLGSLVDFLYDDADWSLRYLVVDARRWWSGKCLLISPYMIFEIDWTTSQLKLDVTRHQVRHGPEWSSSAIADRSFDACLFFHHDWPR